MKKVKITSQAQLIFELRKAGHKTQNFGGQYIKIAGRRFSRIDFLRAIILEKQAQAMRKQDEKEKETILDKVKNLTKKLVKYN